MSKKSGTGHCPDECSGGRLRIVAFQYRIHDANFRNDASLEPDANARVHGEHVLVGAMDNGVQVFHRYAQPREGFSHYEFETFR